MSSAKVRPEGDRKAGRDRGGRVIVKHSLKNINASDEIILALWQGCFASPNESCLMRYLSTEGTIG